MDPCREASARLLQSGEERRIFARPTGHRRARRRPWGTCDGLRWTAGFWACPRPSAKARPAVQSVVAHSQPARPRQVAAGPANPPKDLPPLPGPPDLGFSQTLGNRATQHEDAALFFADPDCPRLCARRPRPTRDRHNPQSRQNARVPAPHAPPGSQDSGFCPRFAVRPRPRMLVRPAPACYATRGRASISGATGEGRSGEVNDGSTR